MHLRVAQPARRVDDEAARLQRVVADGHAHLVREDRSHQRARELRAVDLLVRGHQRIARQRVVVLPAGQRADTAGARVHGRQTGAVALAPDHALVVGRRDLAALEHQAAIGIEHQLRVVQTAVVAFVHAQHHHHAQLARRGGHGVRHRARHGGRTLHQQQVVRALQHGRLHEREVGVVGHEGLGEDDQLHALLRGVAQGLEHARQRAALAREVRRDLRRGRADLAVRHHSVQVSMITAPAFLWSSTMSSTSSGLIGRMPSINEPSPWPYKACNAKRQA
jgi:hypothetical protein